MCRYRAGYRADKMTVLTAATKGSYQFPAGVFVVGGVVVVVMLVGGAFLIYRDVERHGGNGLAAALAWVLFWPAGLYLWLRARSAKAG